MKGIVLAGGQATRLRPLTKITSKQLLPVYDRPMIYYPLQALISSGIRDILIVIAPEYSGHYLNLLGSGKEFGASFSYAVQESSRGLADAFIVGEDFLGSDYVTMILGDNIFDRDFSGEIRSFSCGGMMYAKKVPDPRRFGVVEYDKHGHAVVGLYTYDNRVVKYAGSLVPSARGEIEITDINNIYLKNNELKVEVIDGLWEDAGTFDSLLRVGNYMAEQKIKSSNTG